MVWNQRKKELENLITKEKKSYEEIGRLYGCTGANIKKVALRLGIKLEVRRKINSNETFGKGVHKTKYPIGKCLNCGKDVILYPSSKGKFCSHQCQKEYEYNEYIRKWKNGEVDGVSNGYSVSNHIRKYLFEKYNNSCQICGWNEINPATGKTPLQIHHIDGNCTNNSESNLQLLCPNHHSLTENYGSRNKQATEYRSQYFNKRVREEYSKKLNEALRKIKQT